MASNENKKDNINEQVNESKPKEKPKLHYLNRKVTYYVFQRGPSDPIKFKTLDPLNDQIDFADYQRIFFNDFGNMVSYNRGIFNRKTPQTPEVYKAKLHTEYDDLTLTSIKDIKEYMSKNRDN